MVAVVHLQSSHLSRSTILPRINSRPVAVVHRFGTASRGLWQHHHGLQLWRECHRGCGNPAAPGIRACCHLSPPRYLPAPSQHLTLAVASLHHLAPNPRRCCHCADQALRTVDPNPAPQAETAPTVCHPSQLPSLQWATPVEAGRCCCRPGRRHCGMRETSC